MLRESYNVMRKVWFFEMVLGLNEQKNTIMINTKIKLRITVRAIPRMNSNGVCSEPNSLLSDFKLLISYTKVMLIRKMLDIKYLMMNAKKARS
jgi:hypothetical protein